MIWIVSYLHDAYQWHQQKLSHLEGLIATYHSWSTENLEYSNGEICKDNKLVFTYFVDSLAGAYSCPL